MSFHNTQEPAYGKVVFRGKYIETMNAQPEDFSETPVPSQQMPVSTHDLLSVLSLTLYMTVLCKFLRE